MQHPDTTTPPTGSAAGPVRLWLRLEGLGVLVLATYLFAWGGHSWMLYAMLFLFPDLAFAAYLAGPRIGAFVYNLLHSYLLPSALAIGLVATGRPAVLPLIWIAHIGFDRLLGYGLKYPSAFSDTHLGRIGRSA